MTDWIAQLLWAVVPSILTGIVLAVFSRQQKKREHRAEEEQQARVEESRLNLDLTFATAQLSYAVAMAIKRGRPNGEVEEAVESYQSALTSYRAFEREKMAGLKAD